MPLLTIDNLVVEFETATGPFRAVDGVSLSVDEREVLAIVGESGSGKSTLGRIVAGTLRSSGGEMLYRGRPVSELGADETRVLNRKIQMVFQDPMASLNPRMRVRDLIAEAPVVHGLWPRRQVDDRLDELMQRVGLGPDYVRRFPHQLSGGERQRVSIARALAVEPEILVCDEAIASLDASIQAQILNLIAQLRAELGLTCLFISHDLGAVHYLADRVAVIYLGNVVELAPAEPMFAAPGHPYTRALVDGVVRLAERRQAFKPIEGEIPSPYNRPHGCPFHPRCPHVMERCRTEPPPLRQIASDRLSACHLAHSLLQPEEQKRWRVTAIA